MCSRFVTDHRTAANPNAFCSVEVFATNELNKGRYYVRSVDIALGITDSGAQLFQMFDIKKYGVTDDSIFNVRPDQPAPAYVIIVVVMMTKMMRMRLVLIIIIISIIVVIIVMLLMITIIMRMVLIRTRTMIIIIIILIIIMIIIIIISSVQLSSVQGGIYKLGKAHMRSTPSHRSFPNVALKTVPMLV